MRISALLRDARAQVAGGWHPTLPTNHRGTITHHGSEDVTQFDVISAIEVAAKGDGQAAVAALSLIGSLLMTPLIDWEMATQRKQQDVLSLFDRAIMRAVANERESNDLASRHR